jgi:hypothetical protein
MLRDPCVEETPRAEIATLASDVRDRNFRIFATEEESHLVARQLHLHDKDPFELFAQLFSAQIDEASRLDASHAFYLGYEMAKARTALTLGKTYRQDEPLNWGLATRPEARRYLKPTSNSSGPAVSDCSSSE